MQTCSSTANLKEPESCRKRKMFKMGKSEKRWKIEKYILGRTDSDITCNNLEKDCLFKFCYVSFFL